MLFVTSDSVVYRLDDKFLFNKDTGFYLACHQGTGDFREMNMCENDCDLWWYVSDDGQAKSFSNGSVSLKPFSDISETIEDEDVPVRRVDALIEQALNAQLSSTEPEVPEVEAEVPEVEAEVPEVEAPVPEVEAEVPEVEAEVPEVEPEVPEVEV